MEWFKQNIPEFKYIDTGTIDLIKEFVFLWSFFEFQFLNCKAKPNSIVVVANNLIGRNKIVKLDYEYCLTYFKKRYFKNGNFTEHFNGLNLRSNDKQVIIESVLSGESDQPKDELAAVLSIILRYRNNLFHGEKWSYNLNGQSDNFRHANEVLKNIIAKDPSKLGPVN